METYRGETRTPPLRDAILTLGIFDGVHLGHQAVLRQLAAWGTEAHAPVGLLTFAQHPRTVLDGRPLDLVTSLEHRLLLFRKAGVDFAWVLDFTPELSRLSAEEFARTYLVERLMARRLILGFDSRFGHDRVGTDSPELAGLAQRLGLAVRTVPPVRGPDGQPVSSTRLRDAILAGDLRTAEALLGRRVSILGRVTSGDARGRRLGYATANLDLGGEVRPPFGVYATMAEFDGAMRGSITNVGYRPTVTPPCASGERPDLLLETHVLDFAGDLYGKTLEVHFVEKLRDELRFPDVTALVEQIRKDEARARQALEALGL